MPFDVAEYVKENLEKVKSTSTGQLVAVCPWCEKHGSFYINRESGAYICFKCENKGKMITGVIAQVEGISFGEARSILLKRNVTFRRKETPESLLDKIKGFREEPEEIEFEDVEGELPDEFVPVFDGKKFKYPSYLKERKITKKTAKEWGMGFCNSGDYYGRIIIPFSCPNGASFVARDSTGKSEIKIKNPANLDQSRMLFGWHMNTINCDLVVCEGPFDAIKLWQHGLPAVALLGKVLHPAQRSLLFRKPKDSAITVMLDPEEVKAPYDVAAQLLCHFENISIARLPDGVDPGASSKAQAFRAYDNAEQFEGARGGALFRMISDLKK